MIHTGLQVRTNSAISIYRNQW